MPSEEPPTKRRRAEVAGAFLAKTPYSISLESVQQARERIKSHVNFTPVMTCSTLDAMVGCKLAFKCELMQKTGSFKARGACNALLKLNGGCTDVVTHSSGNHAQAVAWAGKTAGMKAHIVMPSNAPSVKKAAVLDYGARIVDCEPTNAARQAMADKVVEEVCGHFVHPSNDPDVMSGQGTVALELLEQAKEVLGGGLDAVIVPIGGGGLTSGVAMAVKSLDPGVLVIAAEPAGAADTAMSKREGRLCTFADVGTPPKTIADRLKTELGNHNWPIIRDLVDEVVTVTEAQIEQALKLVWERMKLAIEPSAAVGVAVALSKEFMSCLADQI